MDLLKFRQSCGPLKKQWFKSYWYFLCSLIPNELEILIILVLKQVTGASGFLGSHIVDQLLEKGYYVKA